MAVKNMQWVIDDWTADVEIMENFSVNIENLLKEA